MPRWVTEESTISSSARAAVSALKQNPSSPEKRSEYVEYLNTLRKQICEFNSTTDSYLDLYAEIKPFRDEYLHYLKASSSIEHSHVLIGDFLQELYYDLNIIHHHRFCFIGYLEWTGIPAPITVKKYAIL